MKYTQYCVISGKTIWANGNKKEVLHCVKVGYKVTQWLSGNRELTGLEAI